MLNMSLVKHSVTVCVCVCVCSAVLTDCVILLIDSTLTRTQYWTTSSIPEHTQVTNLCYLNDVY